MKSGSSQGTFSTSSNSNTRGRRKGKWGDEIEPVFQSPINKYNTTRALCLSMKDIFYKLLQIIYSVSTVFMGFTLSGLFKRLFNLSGIPNREAAYLLGRLISLCNYDTFQKMNIQPVKKINKSSSYSSTFFRELYSDQDVKEVYKTYVQLIFILSDPEYLSETLKIKCCNECDPDEVTRMVLGRHPSCMVKWYKLRDYLLSDFLVEIEVNSS